MISGAYTSAYSLLLHVAAHLVVVQHVRLADGFDDLRTTAWTVVWNSPVISVAVIRHIVTGYADRLVSAMIMSRFMALLKRWCNLQISSTLLNLAARFSISRLSFSLLSSRKSARRLYALVSKHGADRF